MTRLPSFLVIGAVKAATTWIGAQLRSHPDIFMPTTEPHFFSSDYARGLPFYESFFEEAGNATLIGEKSADYFSHPRAAERIAGLIPSARLVVQLRNPIERAYSDYKMLYRRGTIKGPPEQYLVRGSEQPRFLDYGLYAEHLQRWNDHFPASQLEVLLYEDVLAAPEETVRRVCEHVGAKPVYSEEVGTRPVNDGSAPLLPLGMRRWLSPLKPLAQPFRGRSAFERVRRLMVQPVTYPPLLPDTRARLADYYAADIARLETMIGRDLRHWLRDSGHGSLKVTAAMGAKRRLPRREAVT